MNVDHQNRNTLQAIRFSQIFRSTSWKQSFHSTQTKANSTMMNIQRRLLLAVSLFAGLLLGPVSAEDESTVGTNATRGLLRGITDQRSLQGLGDWQFCSSSSQCRNGCCSSKYSNDGKLKCTPLSGGYNAAICVSGTKLGDWQFCSSNSQCANGCCSNQYSNDGKLKCTPGGCSGGGGTGGGGSGGASLYSGSGSGTYYYDVAGATCNGVGFPETSGYPYCTSFDSSKYKRLNEYGTNKIVAIDRKVLAANRATMCGKQIQVFKNGVEVPGPFVVFDGCEACEGGGRIDFSLTALNQIDNGNACQSGVVPGITWKVTNTQIIPFIP